MISTTTEFTQTSASSVSFNNESENSLNESESAGFLEFNKSLTNSTFEAINGMGNFIQIFTNVSAIER